MPVTCKECKGTGQIVFTRERGGPTCTNCGGSGQMTKEVVQRVIAGILDHTSVYMGGPSQQSMCRAGRIVAYLAEQEIL